MAQTQIHGDDQIQAGTISDGRVASAAAIQTSKLQDGAEFIKRSGAVPFTGDQSHGGNKITSLGNPTAASDAATKSYVDAAAVGLDVKPSVRAATTVNGALATAYENGDTIDGVVLATGDRILIKNQTTGSENGIYTVNASGAPTRSSDADTSAEVTAGMFTFVEEGTANGDTGWLLTTNQPITLGTTSLTFTQFSGPGAVVAGNGLTRTGTTIDVVSANEGILVTGDDIGLQAWTTDDSSDHIGQRVIRATPSGTINGTNTVFTLAQNNPGLSEEVFLNGVLQEPGGADYTVSGTGNKTLTFVVAPKTGARLRVNYTM